MAYRVEATCESLTKKPKIKERGFGSFLYSREYRQLMKQQAKNSIYEQFECRVVVLPNATIELRDEKTGEVMSTRNSAVLGTFLEEKERGERIKAAYAEYISPQNPYSNRKEFK